MRHGPLGIGNLPYPLCTNVNPPPQPSIHFAQRLKIHRQIDPVSFPDFAILPHKIFRCAVCVGGTDPHSRRPLRGDIEHAVEVSNEADHVVWVFDLDRGTLKLWFEVL